MIFEKFQLVKKYERQKKNHKLAKKDKKESDKYKFN